MKFALLLLLLLPLPARAADLSCGPVEEGAVTLDGLTDDWSDVEGLDAGGRDANLSFTLKCNVDARTLWLLVDVRDNYFVRTAATRPGEDHLTLTLGGRTLVVFPGDAGKIKERVTWGASQPARGVRVASALQPHGWAVELAVPLADVGHRAGAPAITLDAVAHDCDSRAALTTERTVELAGHLVLAEADAALDGFLQEHGLGRSAIYFDQPMTNGRGAGGRAVLAGPWLAFISGEYVYQQLPVRGRADVVDARLVDLGGDGRQALVVRYVERAAAGSREVLAVFRPGGEQIARVFACEVAKAAGGARVEDKVSFVKRGKATDLVVEAGAAAGFSAANYREAPATDMVPILLPWGDERRARYQFSGSEYRRAP